MSQARDPPSPLGWEASTVLPQSAKWGRPGRPAPASQLAPSVPGKTKATGGSSASDSLQLFLDPVFVGDIHGGSREI